jgi:hypothetical protein
MGPGSPGLVSETMGPGSPGLVSETMGPGSPGLVSETVGPGSPGHGKGGLNFDRSCKKKSVLQELSLLP